MRTGKLGCFAVVAILAVIAGVMPAAAQSPSFSSFTSADGLSLNGTATVPAESGVLRLTAALGGENSQDGSAYFTVQQPVQNGFTTTFHFQFKNPSSLPADGIAFVIQNSSTTELGGGGGSIGYDGIPNSLAVEFDSYYNDATSGVGDPNPATHGGITSHVAVQSCGTAANKASHLPAGCGSTSANIGGVVSLGSDFGITEHTVIITYTPPCGDCSTGNLQVNLDGSDLFEGGVAVNLSTLLSLNNGTAWVGFTGATGGSWEEQDILSWTYQPAMTVTTTQPTVFEFQNNAYDFQAQLNTGNTPVQALVVPIVMTEAACNALVQRTYAGAKCFVYQNAGGTGADGAVLLELTCPGQANPGECNPFDAELGTNFTLSGAPGVNLVNTADPFPGWLKGHGPDLNHPCVAPDLNAPNPDLFLSNQVDFFMLTATDPFTKGGSGGTGSCWVATYNQPDEVPPGITITSPTATTYTQNQAVTANYSCFDPTSSHLPESDTTNHPKGPYLTLAACVGTAGNGAAVDTSTVGPHMFTVTARDTGKNQASQTVNYIVALPSTDAAIAELGALTVKAGGKITYTVGVGDLGPNNAPGVVATASIPAGTTFVSATGNREVCAIVNRRLSCTVTPLSCSHTTTSVSCTVGTLTPVSLSSLNGATMTVTVQLGTSSTVAAGKTLKNTVSVTSTAPDTNPSNNSATWTSLITR